MGVLIVDAIKFRETLVREARPLVGDSAEDVVHDLMEYLLRLRVNTCPTPNRLLRWYIRNRGIQQIRKNKTRSKHEIACGDGLFLYPDRWEPEETESEKSETINVMLEAMKEIHPFARELFILVVVDGHQLANISKATGIEPNRLGRIYRGTKQILNEKTSSKIKKSKPKN